MDQIVTNISELGLGGNTSNYETQLTFNPVCTRWRGFKQSKDYTGHCIGTWDTLLESYNPKDTTGDSYVGERERRGDPT